MAEHTDPVTCHVCGGEGVVGSSTDDYEFSLDEVCPRCEGAGWTEDEVTNEDAD